MVKYEEDFISAMLDKAKIKLTFYSKQDQRQLIRLCAPLDFGPSRVSHNKDNRFHLWDYESDQINHVLSLLPDQIIKMEFTHIEFDPAEFINWSCNWFIVRDWGEFS